MLAGMIFMNASTAWIWPPYTLNSSHTMSAFPGTVRIGLAEVHSKEHDAEIFIHRCHASGNEGVFHNLLRLDIFAPGTRAAGTGRDDAVLDAIGVGHERSVNSNEAADFESPPVRT